LEGSYSRKSKKDPQEENCLEIKYIDNYNEMTRPFLKWVGGKSKLLKDILPLVQREFNNYHEIFLGGGSVLLGIVSLISEGKINMKGKIYAYDINDKLINVYKQVQSNHEELYKHIEYYTSEYNSIKSQHVNRRPTTIEEAITSKESYYYWIRSKYNKTDNTKVDEAALFLFLNKTCFRGIYREGPNGFNVPFGNYKSALNIISEKELLYMSKLIKNVVFRDISFIESIKNVKTGDFVYLDPPYAPENSKSFVGYVSEGFNMESHKRLFNEIKKLEDVKFIMSNSKVDLVIDNFKEFNCIDVIARRAINCKNPEATTTEVIIYN